MDWYQKYKVFTVILNSLIGIDHEKEEFKFCLFFWGGKPMSFYMVSAQLNSFWGKAIGHM